MTSYRPTGQTGQDLYPIEKQDYDLNKALGLEVIILVSNKKIVAFLIADTQIRALYTIGDHWQDLYRPITRGENPKYFLRTSIYTQQKDAPAIYPITPTMLDAIKRDIQTRKMREININPDPETRHNKTHGAILIKELAQKTPPKKGPKIGTENMPPPRDPNTRLTYPLLKELTDITNDHNRLARQRNRPQWATTTLETIIALYRREYPHSMGGRDQNKKTYTKHDTTIRKISQYLTLVMRGKPHHPTYTQNNDLLDPNHPWKNQTENDITQTRN